MATAPSYRTSIVSEAGTNPRTSISATVAIPLPIQPLPTRRLSTIQDRPLNQLRGAEG